jgi:glycosyltransferase involved in cell wall biosynthesis
MASSVKNHELREPPASTSLPAPKRATTVFVPLVTPFLYGMERAVIELFDALRPEVEPYFLQSNRIFERRPPIIEEMIRRGFSMELLPDRTDWERLARPRSLKHLAQMVTASVRSNVATLKGVRGKDVLYVPGISAASSSLLAAIYCRLTGRRVIHHFHDLGTSNRLFPLWVPLVTDFVHNTEFGYKAIAKKLPAIRSRRNFIVPYIMELDERLPDNPDVCRELLEWRNVFYVGQISPHKGLDLLVKAFVAVASKHADVKLHLVGEGKPEFRAELERQIRAAGLEGRVKFWGFREDATRLLRFAYMYVHSSPPSRFHESFGRSVVEAMAYGVPIVCFRSGALQEIVLHEKTGLICEETPEQLAEAIDRFLQDAGFRNASGESACERFNGSYSKPAVLGHWRHVFEPARGLRPKAPVAEAKGNS